MAKLIHPALALLLATSLPLAARADDPPPEATPGPFGLTGSLQDRFEAITDNSVDLEHAVLLRDVEVADRFARLHLVEVTVAPIRMASGPAIGAWFKGSCTVSYTPPVGQERDAVRRGTGHAQLERVGCTEGYLLTDDDDVLGLLGLDTEPAETTVAKGGEWLRRRRKRAEVWQVEEHFHSSYAVAALRRSLSGAEGGETAFGSLSFTVRTEPFGHPAWLEQAEPLDLLSYARDPGGIVEANEVVAVRAGSVEGPLDTRYTAFLASHPWEGDPDSTYVPPNLDMISAELDLDIATGLGEWAEMTATAKVTLTTREVAVRSVELSLMKDQSFERWFGVKERLGFDVHSVVDFKGRPLDFLHQGGALIVRLRSPLPPGQGEVLTVTYSGNAMPRVGPDSFGLLANYPWWPSPGGHDRLTWKVHVCVPKAFRAVGTGSVVSEEIDGKRRCERWEEPVPITFPAVNVGRWTTGETEGPHGVRVRAFFLAQDDNKMEAGLAQAVRILEFYEQLFGPYPYQELDLAQSYDNMGFWQAPAGLVEFSKSVGVVERTLTKDRRYEFYPEDDVATLAHELGHQWWGHVVGWKSYRDQWVSETFAEYASFLYMAHTGGREHYLGRLEYWEYVARKSDPYGPAVLGFRLGRGRIGQMYCRGPYILHMLRRLVGDEAFTEFTSSLAGFVANRNASSGDIVAVARSVLGPDVDWFFEQWLFRTGLPELEASWRVEDRSVRVTVRQTQDGPPFRLMVPIQLKGKRRSSEVHMVVLDAAETDVVLPLPPGGEVKALLLDPEREILSADKRVRRAD